MGFFDSLKSFVSGRNEQDKAGFWIYVRCRRCGEFVKTRVDLQSALNLRDEGGYLTRKTLVGNQRCFQRIDVTLYFDEKRRLVDQEIQHGEFISAEEYIAQTE